MTSRSGSIPLIAFAILLTLPHARAGGQTKITIGVAAMSPRTLPLLLAQEQGLFAKHGIDACIVLIKGAPILVASLISGDLEVGYTGGTSVLGAAASGPYLKILSSISSKLTHTMLARASEGNGERTRRLRYTWGVDLSHGTKGP